MNIVFGIFFFLIMVGLLSKLFLEQSDSFTGTDRFFTYLLCPFLWPFYLFALVLWKQTRFGDGKAILIWAVFGALSACCLVPSPDPLVVLAVFAGVSVLWGLVVLLLFHIPTWLLAAKHR